MKNIFMPAFCTKEGCTSRCHALLLCKIHYNRKNRITNRHKIIKQRGFSVNGKRFALLQMLGAECARCGYRDIRALQLDHINGGGCKERKEMGHNTKLNNYYWSHPEEAFRKLQVLCANCNWIKLTEERDRKYGETQT